MRRVTNPLRSAVLDRNGVGLAVAAPGRAADPIGRKGDDVRFCASGQGPQPGRDAVEQAIGADRDAAGR